MQKLAISVFFSYFCKKYNYFIQNNMSEDKFKNTYRIPPARAQWWDYGRNAAYFITVCTAYREHFFGNIVDNQMQLSPVGVIANSFWYEIKKHAKFVDLGEFVVMPNHIHGILILDKPYITNVNDNMPVETRHALSLQSQSQPQSPELTCGQKRFQNQGKNTISSIVGAYKSAVTNYAHKLGYNFKWQPRFHDTIVKNNDDYNRIANYIRNNPENWGIDELYKC